MAIGIYLAGELRDWKRWHNWEDDEDEPNPAPLLCAMWKIWSALQRTYDWLWWKLYWPLKSFIRRKRFPDSFTQSPVDEFGMTPEAWLLIAIVGLWELKWFDYDETVKKNWDDFVRVRDTLSDRDDVGSNKSV